MRTSADPAVTRRLTATAAGFLALSFLAAARCSYDLSLPDPPPPRSCLVRVVLTIQTEGQATAEVSGVRQQDERGAPAAGSVSGEMRLPDLGQVEPRTETTDLPEAGSGTMIEPGSWQFKVTVRWIVDGKEVPRETTCTALVMKNGVNWIEVREVVDPLVPSAAPGTLNCDGSFVKFTGEHDVGIDQVSVRPPEGLRVGASPQVSFIARNWGANEESFDVLLRAKLGTGPPLPCPANDRRHCWAVRVENLAPGSSRVEPGPNQPQLTWDTSGLAAGTYQVEGAVDPAVTGDASPSNNKDTIDVVLAAGDKDGDGRFDDQDNCPMVANPQQENCDTRPAGDACDTPVIRTVEPNCGIAAGDIVIVMGFGFAGVQPGDITVGTATVQNVVSRTACQLDFTSPVSNPTGTLRIATNPPVEARLCCSTPEIRDFNPVAGSPGALVTVLGCGFSGAEVYLEPAAGAGMPSGRITPVQGSTANILRFNVPGSIMRNAEYYIHLVGNPPAGFDIRSTQKFRVN